MLNSQDDYEFIGLVYSNIAERLLFHTYSVYIFDLLDLVILTSSGLDMTGCKDKSCIRPLLPTI
jgi:hypothetical protein